jgi:hypothetical protein
VDLSTALAVDPARYAIAGRVPSAALRPASADEVVEAVRACAAERRTIVPWGGGVSLVRGAALERYDVALDLTGLDRIVEYDPEDFTLTAECGAPIASLRSALGARRQELPLEGAHAERATLGGVLAANTSGPRRLRFGAPRDRILGARFVLGDGTLARSGGKVVKNVAGYAIHRLLCGSRGGLAILLASLKVAPTAGAGVRRDRRATHGSQTLVSLARLSGGAHGRRGGRVLPTDTHGRLYSVIGLKTTARGSKSSALAIVRHPVSLRSSPACEHRRCRRSGHHAGVSHDGRQLAGGARRVLGRGLDSFPRSRWPTPSLGPRRERTSDGCSPGGVGIPDHCRARRRDDRTGPSAADSGARVT